MARSMDERELALSGASVIYDGFDVYHTHFKKIARRGRSRFEAREWHGLQEDAVERLDLYKAAIDMTLGIIRALLGREVRNRCLWAGMKDRYSDRIAGRDDVEMAETFFNSVTRRIFSTVGVDPHIEFVASGPRAALPPGPPVFRAYRAAATTDLVRAILTDYPWDIGYEDLERDVGHVAAAIDTYLGVRVSGQPVSVAEMVNAVFYRNKGAYLVGRIRAGGQTIPLILPLLNSDGQVYVDAALLTEDEANIVFGYTRSYFHVEAERPSELIAFLKTIMPRKRIAELYISLGYNKHGKTELYRDLLRHLATTDDRFEIAPGTKGMVMTVFTMPSYDLVFKIIKDRFAETKTSTRADVIERYQLVFHHDRAGRLIDAQEFEHLEFDRARFTDELLEELADVAGRTVSADDDKVVIRHLYIERRVTPLNLYIQEREPALAREAVIDYGTAIKDLAATNIFPGDLFLKNFGVTRHGRIVFYDYDELCLLTDCNFRRIPEANGFWEDMEAEPWFSVGENDVFPEQFSSFLGLQGDLRRTFLEHHGDLFGIDYWLRTIERHRSGEVIDLFPYRQSRRFPRSTPVPAD